MTAFMVWMAALWLGWKIDEAAERIAEALESDDDE
jgi:hypothetical protein